MNEEEFKKVNGTAWEEAVLRSNRLFFEADKLDEIAYGLLKQETLDASIWADFVSAKKEAENKYSEAQAEWRRIKEIMRR